MSREFSPAHFSSSFHYLLTYYCASIFLLIYWEYHFFILFFFFLSNAHLINSQAAFYTKSPSCNIFLLSRSLKKELLSFKTYFFQEFYLFNHQTIRPEIDQCECLPLKLPETEHTPCDAQECFRDGVLQGHAVAIWAWSRVTQWNYLQPYSFCLPIVLPLR